MENIKNSLTLKAIHTEEEYYKSLENMRLRWESPENSPKSDYLEVLSILVEHFEKKHCAIEPLDPIEAIKYEMEEKGLYQRDLIKFLAAKSEFLKFSARKDLLFLK